MTDAMLVAAEAIARTSTGRQRRENEDSMYARAPVFVVADGMGGAQAGEVASRIATDVFSEGLSDAGSPEERLTERVLEANRRIYELSQADHERAGMGTTLTAAYLDDAHVAIAHVGDSRAYLLSGGKLTRLTEDHSLVDELRRQGKLTEKEAAEHPQRSIITRALGPEPAVTVDTWRYPVSAGDIVLLCSDGLTSMISEDEVAELLARTSTLERAADALIAKANQAGGRDNITVVLVRLGQARPGEAPQAAPASAAAASPEAASAGAEEVDAPTLHDPGSQSAVAVAQPRARVPLARTQGRPQPGRASGRPPRRFVKPLAALAATAIVAGLILAGGYLATRQLYFVGTNAQGIVTIYRGLPYDLPLGIRLYETYFTSGLPAALIPAQRRSAVLDDRLRSEADASSLVADLELGRVSG